MRSFLTNEIIDGFGKWCKVCLYCLLALWFLELLPRLPNELSGPIVEMLMSKLK